MDDNGDAVLDLTV